MKLVSLFSNLITANLLRDIFLSGKNGETDRVANNAYINAIILSIVRLLASLSISSFSKWYHRRSLYFTSAALTTLSLVLVGTSTYFTSRYSVPSKLYNFNVYHYGVHTM